VDNFYGGYQAAMCLVNGGAKRMAHICGTRIYESSIERLNGYIKALQDSGMGVDESLIGQGNFTVQGGYDVMSMWIQKGIVPDAVFAADDKTAFGVLDAARKYKLRVPEDISVIGYDDHPFASSLHPGLSTVSQPAEELGRFGVELLLDIIKGKVKRAATVVIRPQVVIRDTTR
jgi:DNA-binding LacI/PurR family transcriptional regulator